MNALIIALQYLPYVLAGVQAVETALAGQPGQTKKAAVMSALSAAANVGQQVPEEHVKVISALIDATVSTLNVTGVFGKSNKAADPVPAK